MTVLEALTMFLAFIGALCLLWIGAFVVWLMWIGAEIEEDEPPRPVSWDPAQGGTHPPEAP